MKILGIGIDVTNNKRIKVLLKNKSFIKRVFGNNELKLSKKNLDQTSYFAKRFSAKEAFAKSMGTGFRNGLNFKDITITNDKYGKPNFKLNNNVKKLIYSKFKIKKFKISLSLADEKKYSIAFSVIHK